MEIMEQDIETLDPDLEAPGAHEDPLREDLECLWITDYCYLKDHVRKVEGDEGSGPYTVFFWMTVKNFSRA